MIEAEVIIKKEKKTKKTKKSEEVNNNSDNVEIKVEQEIVEEKSIKLDDVINSIETEEENIINVEISDESEEKNGDELINSFQTLSKNIEDISKLNFKDYSFNKTQITLLTKLVGKINKSCSATQNSYNDFISKEACESFKTKDAKSKKVKKTVNKKDCAVNKLKKTYPEVLKFMNLDEDTLISQTDIQKAICNYVKNKKLENNPDIVFNGDNKRFNIIGDLKNLFNFLITIQKERGQYDENKGTPENLSYTELMTYFKYCFPIIKN